MADKRPADRSALDSARSWMEQRRPKGGVAASFAPHTPPAQRSISTFSSPGSILGKEEDVVIIELTQRYLQAGVEGDSGPQCQITFSPENNRRLGDYRIWLPTYRRKTEPLRSWGKDYQLWCNDVVGIDLGLLSDVLERTVREAYNKYLLLDAGTSRLALVLPSLMPHPVLETILSTLFQRWMYPSITLLPSPTMAIMSAGLRSGLVVDIGWEETTITSVYEFREISSHRSTRAMKLLTQTFASELQNIRTSGFESQGLRFDLELVEEILIRAIATISPSGKQAVPTQEASQLLSSIDNNTVSLPDGDDRIEIEWPSKSSSTPVAMSKTSVMTTLMTTFLGSNEDTHFDDDEIPLPQLIFKALLSLAPDVRGVCMSRIVYTGYLTETSVLRARIFKELSSQIASYGWTTIKGKHMKYRPAQGQTVQGRTDPADAKHNIQLPPGKDEIEKGLQQHKAKVGQPSIQGELREVHSLGSWAGASLLTSLKIRGFVEVDRDRFLSHGLTGASRDNEISLVPQHRMSSFGLPVPGKANDRNGWSLGGWG